MQWLALLVLLVLLEIRYARLKLESFLCLSIEISYIDRVRLKTANLHPHLIASSVLAKDFVYVLQKR